MDAAQFRRDFPEFADSTRFPIQQVDFWCNMGKKLVSQDRFGDLYTEAVELFAAHNLVLSAQSRMAVASGGLPGGQGGTVASKGVGSVSVSYDTAGASELNAGHWNQTTYGRQYIRLARLIGQGCYQL
jgi:hypothetical protein